MFGSLFFWPQAGEKAHTASKSRRLTFALGPFLQPRTRKNINVDDPETLSTTRDERVNRKIS